MKRKLLFILLIIFTIITYSQVEINKVYDNFDGELFANDIFETDTGFICVGCHLGTLIDDKSIVIFIDSLGNISSYKYFDNDTMTIQIYHTKKLDNGNYLSIGRAENDSIKSNLLLIFDNQFNIIREKYLNIVSNDSLFYEVSDVTIDYDGGLIFVGSTNINNSTTYADEHWHIFLYKTDSDGNLLWRKTFDNPNSEVSVYGFGIKKLFGHGYLISAHSYNNSNRAWLTLKIDNNYENPEYKYYGIFGYITGMMATSDSCIVLTGSEVQYNISFTTYNKTRILKFDSNLNIVIDKLCGKTSQYSGWSKPTELCSGNYMFVETTEYSSTYYKTSNDCIELLEFEIPVPDSILRECHVFNFTETNSNEIVSCGQYFGFNEQLLWITKIDSISDFATCNASNDIPIMETKLIKYKIYPNPTNRILYIDIENLQKTQIISLNGEIIGTYKDINIIDLSNYRKGLYIIKIITSIGIVNDKVIVN